MQISHLDPVLAPAARAFERMLADGRELGAELAVLRRGRPLLVICGGTKDAAGSPWVPGTLVQVFSTGKPIAAAAALAAVADGAIGLDTPVAEVWAGYRDDPGRVTTLRDVLTHRAGKSAFSARTADLAPDDARALRDDLAASAPEHPDGFGSVEHASTYGHLIDGVLAAVGAPSVADAAPLLGDLVGAVFRFGVPVSELAAVADLEVVDEEWVAPYLASPTAARALTRPAGLLDPALLNGARWRRTSFPAVGLHTDAVSLARWYDDLAASLAPEARGRLRTRLGEPLLREAVTGAGAARDGFTGDEADWALGMRVDGGETGMGGLGGSAAWHSPGHDYSLGFVTRGLGTHQRVDELADLVEECLP